MTSLSALVQPPAPSPSGAARFTDTLWQQATSVRAAIDELEFLQQLGSGTLPVPAFRYYLEQDALYLAGYAKALALLAAAAPDPQAAAFWASSASTAVLVEAGLHEELLAGDRLHETADPAADLARTERAAAEHSPTCLGYVSYLIATAATAPYPVAAAAVLPCYWIYADVSSRLATDAAAVLTTDPDHPYARWVATYDGAEFQASVATARALVDAAAAAATPEQRDRMTEAFLLASRYELLFWDTALHRVPWPV
ncbi:thiaminase II/PqqC family protein [Nakamurella leprariae]|uniref:Sox C-terminal domain-containing protein n=1 Tax=Nakamurella leprariae TaxID=2803911 RepID=A0A938YCT2_9ACTN|nr:hypothetical protein [Nakamurella leprariae]MBM9467226.1 hypothetical protein [Nakamurella leprariae]